MSETRFHGVRVTESTDLVTAINDVDSSVIGIVATADDADAELFPLNKPTLLTRVNDMLGKCGTTGTLYRALKAIADQVSTKVIVVRVAEHKEEDGKTQDQLVIGGSESDGSYTGMYALLVAEQDESIGYRPRILAAPELDTEAVTKSLCVIAGKLRAFVYASCHGCDTMADAIIYRQKFNEREVMLLWPDFIAYNPKSGKNETFPAPAYACGLRAYIDHEQGWHKSLSNVPVKNVLGMSRHVFWSLQAEDSDANSLNNKEITTIIRRNGFRFWGNRTPETNAYIFEVYTRTAQVLADSIAEAQFETIDSPLTPANVKDVISAIRAKLDSLVTAGKLIGAECWYDVVDNGTTNLRQGRVRIRYKYTPVPPLEDMELYQSFTDEFFGPAFAVLGGA
ncbi:TPA: phage tail sheath family protein [Escherichia coli]|uniref:Phage tail sheath family protein n=13 Tax=Escherichia coli TaxID=562 RepID=A0A7A7MUQ5_ECOLX|nr:phage tail sheath family protein [Escherichia coli]HAO9869259.1 phage tail sheath family protein [Escherichia coli O25b:H4-ST131]EEW8331187.1 phage tail sheath family protein [Escherichia coli]EFD7718144.1 phage tail sheath family protein [Escherichia coli]EFI1722768.1 phage tail sheath family protein [Escherichia coli]EIX6058059.1 phage tail sheath family protein [Escherichia coli]